MRPLMQRDYAPSRLAYRIQRLMLTPVFLRGVLWGLPAGFLATIAALWLADPDRRAELSQNVAEVRRQIEARPEFQVQLLAIDGASPALDARIRSDLRLRLPMSSFDIDLAEIRGRVASLDPVADVRVLIRPGGVLHIEVEERQPAVIERLPAGAGMRLLDATGHPIAPLPRREELPDLPLIAGAGADRAVAEVLTLAKASAPISRRIRGFVRVGERRWDVVLERDLRIHLPADGAVEALDRAIALDRAQDLLSRDIVAVDLRDPQRPTVRLSAGATGALQEVGDAAAEVARR